MRPFQIDLLSLGPPSQKFGVGRSTWKRKKNDSLPAFSKSGKVIAPIALNYWPSFQHCGAPLHCYTRPSKVAIRRHQHFPHDLYRNYSNSGPLFLIIQFFVFSTQSIKIVGRSGPRNNKLIWNGLTSLPEQLVMFGQSNDCIQHLHRKYKTLKLLFIVLAKCSKFYLLFRH